MGRKSRRVKAQEEQVRRLEDWPADTPLRDRGVYLVVKHLGDLQEWLLRKVGEPCWRSSDGRIRRLRDMSTSHLYNCMALLDRQMMAGDRYTHTQYDQILRELDRRLRP